MPALSSVHLMTLQQESESVLKYCKSEVEISDESGKRFWWTVGSIYVLCDVIVILLSLLYLKRLSTKLCSRIPNYGGFNYAPSPIAKFLAFCVPGLFLITGVFWAVLEIQYLHCLMSWDLWKKLELMPAILGNIVYYFYYWFLTSMLKSYMAKESRFRTKIPSWLFIAIRFMVVFNLISFVLKTYFHWITEGSKYYKGQPYLYYYLFTNGISSTLIDITLLYVYKQGLKNVARWYDERHNDPANLWSLSIYKIISRCSVTMILSSLCNLILICYDVWHYYGPETKDGSEIYLSAFGMIFWSILIVINTVTYLWTVYFIFPFSQTKYDCLCDNRFCYCDKKMYNYLMKQHKEGFKNGDKCHDPIFIKQPSCDLKIDVNSSMLSNGSCSTANIVEDTKKTKLLS